MEDKYLDNVFREKLELPQQHDFDESAWLDLENQLEEKSKRRIIIPWRWVAAAGIMLPMLMMSFYFYYELQQTEQQLANLETKMNNLLSSKGTKSNENLNNKVATNTNLVENAIVLRQSATRPKSVEDITLTRKSQNYSLSDLSDNNIAESVKQSKENADITNSKVKTTLTNNQVNILKEEEEIKEVVETTFLAKIESNSRAKNAYALNPKNKVATNGFKRKKTIPNLNHLGFIHNTTESNRKENFWERTTEFFTPVGFEVSIGTQRGIQIPESMPLATIKDEKPYFKSNGVEVAANFINGVDLVLGAAFAKYSYVTTTIGQDFPNVEPNNIGDIFNNVQVTDEVVQVPIGLRYNFGNYDDVFAPFAEIGMIAQRNIQRGHRFEYLPMSRGEEPYAILPTPQKSNDSFAVNTATASVGVKWNPNIKNRILNNVVIQAEAFVNADNETPELEWTAGVGVSASYSF